MNPFKVGDKVKFISPDSLNAQYFRSGITGLEILKVDNEVDEENCLVAEADGSDEWWVNHTELELNTTEESKAPLQELYTEIPPPKELSEKDKAVKCLMALSRVEGAVVYCKATSDTKCITDDITIIVDYFQELLKELDR